MALDVSYDVSTEKRSGILSHEGHTLLACLSRVVVLEAVLEAELDLRRFGLATVLVICVFAAIDVTVNSGASSACRGRRAKALWINVGGP